MLLMLGGKQKMQWMRHAIINRLHQLSHLLLVQMRLDFLIPGEPPHKIIKAFVRIILGYVAAQC